MSGIGAAIRRHATIGGGKPPVFRRRQTSRETAPDAASAAAAPVDRSDAAAGDRSGEAADSQPLRFEKGHAMASKTPSPPMRPDLPRRHVDIPGAPGSAASAPQRRGPPGEATAPSDSAATERKLIVGREISLNGEINACDHLVVEGRVEARLADCKIIEVAEAGTFKGSAEIEEATIGGRFEGDLVVRGRLRLLGAGIVAGTVRYGELEVEAGGRIVGTLEPLETTVTPMPEPREAARERPSPAPDPAAGQWQPTREAAVGASAGQDDSP